MPTMPKRERLIKWSPTPNRRDEHFGEFEDCNGVACYLQDSSALPHEEGDSMIWFGVEEAEPQRMIPGKGWTPVLFSTDVMFTTQMHLNQDQVAALIPALQYFVKRGRLPPR